MGKSGELLRQKKMDNVKYTLTKAQMIEHDRRLIEEKRAELEKQVMKEARAYIDRTWDERIEIFNSKDDFKLAKVLNLLLSVSIRVLVEDFGWKPVPKSGGINPRLKVLRFADALANEISDIVDDKSADIRDYAEKTYQRYGIKFRFEDYEGGNDEKSRN